MKFIIDKKVFEKFPNLIVAIPVMLGFNNSKSAREVLQLLRQTEAEFKQNWSWETYIKDNRVASYLDCYRKFGVDPMTHLPTHVGLAKRVLEGGQVPDINPMVNLCNIMCLKYITPFGEENLDSLYGNFVLKIANGGEQWIPLGSKEKRPAGKGELVWIDDYDISSRCLNWRQGERTKLTKATKNGYFIMEGFADVNKDNIEKVAEEFATFADQFFGGKGNIYWLDKEKPEVEISFKTKILDEEAKKELQQPNVKKQDGTAYLALPIPDRNTQNDLPQLFQTVNWEGENTLAYKLRQIIFRATNEMRSQERIGDKFSLKLEDVKIEHPKVENYGDYSTNIALVLSGKLNMEPIDLANQIVKVLNSYIKIYQSKSSVSDSNQSKDIKKIAKIESKAISELLESVSVAGPGFINLTLRKEYLSSLLRGVLDSDYGFTTTSNHISQATQALLETGLPLKGKKIMVEFAHPNTHKEFHIGHLRNICIGESLVRTLETIGAKLFRANYEGDVGLHVAKAIWGVREKIKKEKLHLSKLRELIPANKAKLLGEGYAMGSKMYEQDEAVKSEIIKLNKSIYSNPKLVELWEETRRWSLEYFDTVYKRLGTHFDRLFFESEVEVDGRQIVIESAKKGIFIKDKDGSIYFPGKKYGFNNCVFVTKENYATYEGKEIALEELQRKTFPYDLSINNVANEQQNFFQLGYKATEVLYPWHKGRHFHLAYGMVNLKGGKLSSRTGQVITADWLIDQAKEKIKEIIKQSSRKDTSGEDNKAIKTPGRWPEDSFQVEALEETIAEKVAVAAVKYSMLKINPRMDISFDLEESVSMDGDSGPYLMYTYARCKSVLRKAGDKDTWKVALDDSFQVEEIVKRLNPEELSLLRTLYRFPEVVVEAGRNLSPNLICSFLFDLAQKFNLFYNKHSILNLELRGQRLEVSRSHDIKRKGSSLSSDSQQLTTNFRLVLTKATSIILKRGLYLLGIDTVEMM